MRTKRELRERIAHLERQLHGWWAAASRAVEIEQQYAARAHAEAAALREMVTELQAEVAELRSSATVVDASDRPLAVGDRVVPVGRKEFAPGVIVQLRESGMVLVEWAAGSVAGCWIYDLERA